MTALDLSNKALRQLKEKFPDVAILNADIEEIPVKADSFDIYIGLRSLHASNLDFRKAVEEALRVTKEIIIISISNGYLINGEIVKGMYNYKDKTIQEHTPYEFLNQIKEIIKKQNLQYRVYEIPSEIVVTITK